MDNISIIIVCFPGAPQVSQEALQQEAELEKHIDMKVEGDRLVSRLIPTIYYLCRSPLRCVIISTFFFFFNSHFTEIIQAMRSRDEDPDLLYVIKFLAAEDIPGLPPGGGITSK